MFFLTQSFLLHGGKQIGVVLGDSQITAEHGSPQQGMAEKAGILPHRVLSGI
ncbi:hypothetical protein APX70_02080 [Pseudomonas syringae pv. maculicola]|uniref:Uncharacterized protein n=1 Tax=Pseudomonas syringae pv. maculicola TaxID=59511 RepID=A0A3M2VCF3_PSEYM|nr:hypothetical protein APX70_02080 [Pseudomonas syringae pv. maculicola]